VGPAPQIAASSLLLVRSVNLHRLVTFFVLIGLEGVAFAKEPTLEFHGNSQISSDALRRYLYAETPTFTESNGDVNQEAVERAALLVSAYYWDHGYAMVRVDDVQIDQANHRVDFKIKSEGDRFTIKSVVVKGTLLRTEKTFLNMLAIKPGAMFSRTVISEDRMKLQRFYEDRAFAYVNVLPLTKVDLPSKTIALTFEIDQGELTFIEKINVDGNTTTSTQTILDLLSFKEGEAFHGGKLESSKARLLKRGGFTDVTLATRKGSTDSSIVISLEIQE
jgi:outer membrane protein insertion porin family